MPRKMAGIAMITIEASIVAIVMLSVVLESAIRRWWGSALSPPLPLLPALAGAPLPFARERPLSVLPWAAVPFDDAPFDDGPGPGGLAPEAPLRSANLDTLIHATSHQLLDRNYLSRRVLADPRSRWRTSRRAPGQRDEAVQHRAVAAGQPVVLVL